MKQWIEQLKNSPVVRNLFLFLAILGPGIVTGSETARNATPNRACGHAGARGPGARAQGAPS